MDIIYFFIDHFIISFHILFHLFLTNELLYSGYISRAFYFGGFGELTEFAKSKLAKIKVIQFIQYIELMKGSKTAKLKLGQMSILQIRQNSAPPN